MAFTEDVAPFFDTAGFAEAATYDGASNIQAIFSAPAADAFSTGGTVPEALVIASDVDADPRGKSLVLASGTYTIREFSPDMTGRLLALKLEAA